MTKLTVLGIDVSPHQSHGVLCCDCPLIYRRHNWESRGVCVQYDFAGARRHIARRDRIGDVISPGLINSKLQVLAISFPCAIHLLEFCWKVLLESLHVTGQERRDVVSAILYVNRRRIPGTECHSLADFKPTVLPSSHDKCYSVLAEDLVSRVIHGPRVFGAVPTVVLDLNILRVWFVASV